MAFYAYDKGELVATTTTLEAAVAVALMAGAGASVSDAENLLFVIFQDHAAPFTKEGFEKWLRRAHAAQERHYPKPPPDDLHPGPADVISLRSRRPVWPATEE